MAIDDKFVLQEMLDRAKIKYDVRAVPERWRGRDGIPTRTESEISVPPHADGTRLELYFNAEGRLLGAATRF